MSRYLSIVVLGLTFTAGIPFLTGCDKKETEKHVDETKHADGSSSVDKTNTTVDPKTGDAKTTVEHKVTGPTTNP